MSELAAMGVGVVVGGMVGAPYTRTMDTGTAWEGLRRPEQLMMHNVLVRHFDTPRLANCLRVTVDTGTQMDALLAALAATLLAAATVPVVWRRSGYIVRIASGFSRTHM